MVGSLTLVRLAMFQAIVITVDLANDETSDEVITAPLPAGSRANRLEFTYTVNPADNISMAGGQLTIDIPAGWTILVKKVQDDGTTLFDESSLFDDVVEVNGGW